MLVTMMSDKEVEVFNYLKNFKVERDAESFGSVKITFEFEENEFFEDTIIVKEITVSEDGEPSVKACTINWKGGKNPFQTKKANKKRKREGKEVNLDEIEDEDEEFSFFDFLTSSDDFAVDIAETLAADFYVNAAQYYAADEMEEEGSDSEDLEDEE